MLPFVDIEAASFQFSDILGISAHVRIELMHMLESRINAHLRAVISRHARKRVFADFADYKKSYYTSLAAEFPYS